MYNTRGGGGEDAAQRSIRSAASGAAGGGGGGVDQASGADAASGMSGVPKLPIGQAAPTGIGSRGGSRVATGRSNRSAGGGSLSGMQIRSGGFQ